MMSSLSRGIGRGTMYPTYGSSKHADAVESDRKQFFTSPFAHPHHLHPYCCHSCGTSLHSGIYELVNMNTS